MMTMQQGAKEFAKILRRHEHGKSEREKFRDFVDMAYCAIAKTMASDEERADQLEERYMRVVNTYRDKEAIRIYPQLLALTWQYCSYFDDFLGVVSGELSVLDSYQGQFFTPMGVSRMMARMQLSAAMDIIDERGYITVGEPACGAGGMVLAAAEELQRQGADIGTQMLVHANDISHIAFQMCYVQLSLAGIPALVERRNTISWELFEQAITPAYRLFHAKHGDVGFQRAKKPASQSIRKTSRQEESILTPEQLRMFE
jgi:hypothetical protein